MTHLRPGAIDCDVHPAVPALSALLPYLDEHWREAVVQRGLDELRSIAYPPNAPLSARPDWRSGAAIPGSDLSALRAQALDPFGTLFAICNCLYGVPMLFSEDMAAGLARAVNDWIAREWLDREPRLRASIVVSPQNAEFAVDEIERCAADPRFVQVLLPVSDELPPGRRAHWPIYAAAARHRLPVGFHAGTTYKHPPTSVGWPSYVTEEYVGQAQAFQGALTSLVCEGVFAKFPDLRVVLLESGVTWLPAHLWRLTKFWRGLRMEVPWVDRPPTEIVREHVRLTAQPFDGPPDPAQLSRLFEQLGSDALLLFATDYPHWQFDGLDALPAGLSPALARKIMVDNPLATYPRLRETVA
jgi:predicted TIM-barrel fold metal-dependent hydrolase